MQHHARVGNEHQELVSLIRPIDPVQFTPLCCPHKQFFVFPFRYSLSSGGRDRPPQRGVVKLRHTLHV